MIINCRFISSIAFHDVLHGFRADHGTGTASLKAKLMEEVVYVIFLYLHKAYDSLDRDRYLDIL